eukprot:SAG11_NODE_15469_length_577_cov_0.859833_1_plen_192_part_11
MEGIGELGAQKDDGTNKLQRIIGVKANAPYLEKDEQIDELMSAIKRFTDWKKETGFIHRPKFDSQFSGRQIHGLYTWIGTIEDPEHLVPLLRFLSRLDELRAEQIWQTVPDGLKKAVLQCTKSSYGLDGDALTPVDTMHGAGNSLRRTVLHDDQISWSTPYLDEREREREATDRAGKNRCEKCTLENMAYNV